MPNGRLQNIPPVANKLLIKLFRQRICCLRSEGKVVGTPAFTLMLGLYTNLHAARGFFFGFFTSGSEDDFIVLISSFPVCKSVGILLLLLLLLLLLSLLLAVDELLFFHTSD